MLEVWGIVSKLAVGIGELLVLKVERLLYLGPLRTVPPRNYQPPLTENLARWAEGLGAWDALHRRGTDLVSRVSDWMNRLGTGYRVVLRRVSEVDAGAAATLATLVDDLLFKQGAVDQAPTPARGRGRKGSSKSDTESNTGSKVAPDRAILWAEALKALQVAPEREELVLVDERNNIVVRPSDVGVGISQVLPVVVAALYRGERGAGAFVAVEQPELHIHPKLQVALADLFIEQSSAGSVSDHWFLLETHSEHILLRLLRRVRESTAASLRADAVAIKKEGDDKLSKPVPVLTPDNVSVIYVQRAEDGSTQFLPLRIDATGEFRDLWPEGFFDERLRELY
jgi:hypothetical protein